jgi:hypothetical protein
MNNAKKRSFVSTFDFVFEIEHNYMHAENVPIKDLIAAARQRLNHIEREQSEYHESPFEEINTEESP